MQSVVRPIINRIKNHQRYAREYLAEGKILTAMSHEELAQITVTEAIENGISEEELIQNDIRIDYQYEIVI